MKKNSNRTIRRSRVFPESSHTKKATPQGKSKNANGQKTTELNSDRDILQFYYQYIKCFAAYILSLVNETESAKSIIERAWLQLAAKWGSTYMQEMKDDQDYYSYLIEISKPIILSYLIGLKAKLKAFDLFMFMDLEVVFNNNAERMIKKEDLKNIRKRIQLEKQPIQSIFELYFITGCDSKEISKKLCLELSKVQEMINKIREIIVNDNKKNT